MPRNSANRTRGPGAFPEAASLASTAAAVPMDSDPSRSTSDSPTSAPDGDAGKPQGLRRQQDWNDQYKRKGRLRKAAVVEDCGAAAEGSPLG